MPRASKPVAPPTDPQRLDAELGGDPALGILLGLRAEVTFFHAWTLCGEARSNRFVAVDDSNAVTLTFEAVGTDAIVTVGERASFGTTRDFVLLATLVGLWQASRAVFGEDLQATLAFAIPEPGYFARFAHVLPPTQFGQPASSLRICCRPVGVPRRRKGAGAVPKG
jgi:hypothetical protein